MKAYKDFWNGFVSNTVAGTGNNFALFQKKEKEFTYRCYIRPLYTEINLWKFWYSNSVDSTFENGQIAFADRPGGEWIIKKAAVGISYTADGGTPEREETLTFGGNISKTVLPEESFWSDEIQIYVPKTAYLVFTWTIISLDDETVIPSTPDSQIPCFSAEGDTPFTFTLNTVKPNLFAVKRENVNRLGFLGDSITQGCGTENDRYEFWAARIGTALKDYYSTWNLGLGYARAKNAAGKGVWFQKASLCDTVIMCLGINDLISEPDSAEQIVTNIYTTVKELKRNNPKMKVILFTLPPINDENLRLEDWKKINSDLKLNSLKYADKMFDMAEALGEDSPKEYMSKFGNLHPDGEGGAAVAKAFLELAVLD